MREMRTAGIGLILAAALAAPAYAAGPYITARAAIIIDAATGEVVWERNSTEPLPPASTTKVMTAVLALESGRLDESFPVSEYAARTPPSGIGLHAGQRMRLRHLLYAVLLNSANDAAEVVAEGLAGSEEAFAERMNQKARAIGATRSHFENPHGLTSEGHVATARDLTTIFRYGLHLPLFRSILETRTIQVPVASVGVHTVGLRSHNRLLTGYAYPVIGKTGYTRPARRCFVGAATRGEREIVIALLGASDLWGDARRLIEFGLGEPERPALVMAGMGPLPPPAPRAPRPGRGRIEREPPPRPGRVSLERRRDQRVDERAEGPPARLPELREHADRGEAGHGVDLVHQHPSAALLEEEVDAPQAGAVDCPEDADRQRSHGLGRLLGNPRRDDGLGALVHVLVGVVVELVRGHE